MSSSSAKRGIVSSLQGPRLLPLNLPGNTTSTPPHRPAKRPRVVNGGGDDDEHVRAPPAAGAARGPVVLYDYTPKVIHARPDEFKALVQRLTGRGQPTVGGGGDQGQEAVLRQAVQTAVPSPSSSSSSQQDPLVLTLRQQILPPPFVAEHLTLPVLPPSPGGADGRFLLSPGSFLFSPATMKAIQELIS